MKMHTVFAAISAVCFGSALHAGILVDRPLAVSNLNNEAGADRSNVAWADSPASGATFNWTYGDDFSIGSLGETYQITDLRVWIIGNLANDSLNNIFSSLSLLGGKVGTSASSSDACSEMTGSQSFACLDAAAISTITTVGTDGSDSNVALSTATYDGNQTYQSSGGAFRDIHEVTFQNLTWNIEGGASYAFFLKGIPGSLGNGGLSPYLSASNASLSGNTQQGADGLIWELAQDAGTGNQVAMEQWNSLGTGWNKSSDINVQISGTATPEPGTLGILAAGLVALGVLRRRNSA